MKKRMATIAIGILMLASAMAVEIYSGDSYSFQTEEFEYYTVVGNSSNMEGMNVSWENGNTTIGFNVRYKPDNFTIVLFNKEEKEVEKIIYRGGGGGSTRTKYVDKIILQPNFYDRNITEIVNKEIPIEKIIYQKNEYNFWIILLLAFSICALVVWIIYQIIKANNDYDSEEIR